MTHVVGKVSCPQIAENDAQGVLHVSERHKFLKATSDAADLTVADVNLFIVELLAIGVGPDFHNLTDSDVELSQIRDLRSLGSRSGLLRRVLLLLLLGSSLLLFLSRGTRSSLLNRGLRILGRSLFGRLS